ncbi:hypothetical protein [Rubritalea tangerina]
MGDRHFIRVLIAYWADHGGGCAIGGSAAHLAMALDAWVGATDQRQNFI